MTKGAVYFHFPTKETLALAIVDAHYATWPAVLKQAQHQSSSPLEAVFEATNLAAQAFRDDPIVRAGARLQVEYSLIDTALPVPYVGWIQALTVLLERAQSHGQLRQGIEPASAAAVIVSSFFGAQHISTRLHNSVDLVERWNEARDLIHYSLTPPELRSDKPQR